MAKSNNQNNITLEQTTALKTKGYESALIKKFQAKHNPYYAVKKLLERHDALITYFTHHQLVDIAAHYGGANNIETIYTCCQELSQKKDIHGNNCFSKDDIVRIAKHDGASKSITTIIEHYSTLTTLGFSNEDIVRMVAHSSGSKSLVAILQHHLMLKTFGFSNADMVKIVSHCGGSNNIAAILEHHSALTELGFNKDDIVNIACRSGGAGSIKFVIKKSDDIKESPIEGRSKLAASFLRKGGKQGKKAFENLLLTLQKNTSSNATPNTPAKRKRADDNEHRESSTLDPSVSEPTKKKRKQPTKENIASNLLGQSAISKELVKKGYSLKQCEKLTLAPSAANAVQVLLQHHDVLINNKYKFTRSQLVKITTHKNSANNIAAIFQYHLALTALGFNNNDMMRIAAHISGAGNMTAILLIQHHPVLTALGFSNHDMVRIVAHNGGSLSIEAVFKHHSTLTSLGFSKDDIVTIAAHPGSTHSISAILKHHSTLITLGFSQNDIVNMVACSGGTGNIKFVIEKSDDIKKSPIKARSKLATSLRLGGKRGKKAFEDLLLTLKPSESSNSQQGASKESATNSPYTLFHHPNRRQQDYSSNSEIDKDYDSDEDVDIGSPLRPSSPSQLV